MFADIRTAFELLRTHQVGTPYVPSKNDDPNDDNGCNHGCTGRLFLRALLVVNPRRYLWVSALPQRPHPRDLGNFFASIFTMMTEEQCELVASCIAGANDMGDVAAAMRYLERFIERNEFYYQLALEDRAAAAEARNEARARALAPTRELEPALV